MAPIPEIDRAQLIDLVRDRPVLWDKKHIEYKHKPARHEAWREICNSLYENYPNLSKTKRAHFQMKVTQTWTRTRDAWVRTINPRNKKRTTPYAHHKRMLFLMDVVAENFRNHSQSDIEPVEYLVSESEEEIKRENETDDDMKSQSFNMCSIDEDIRAKRLDSCSIDNEMTSRRSERDSEESSEKNVRYSSTYAPFLYEDRHFCFFQSIQPTLALLDDDQILEFQSGVISLLQRIKGGVSP